VTWRRINRLRERVAIGNGARPSFVHLVFVRCLFGQRVDVRFEWVGGLPPCLVHTEWGSSPRRAIRQALAVSDHIRPGVRFRAQDPANQEPYA
jgi:hypothetical protein